MQRKRSGTVNLGGRPPLPPDEKLSERVMVNLTRAERAALRRLARGEREGAYVRQVLVRHLRGKGEKT
jgi:hypothetical protein